MMPVTNLMERICSVNEECEAPAAVFVLHNAFINLVHGSVGFHRHDSCRQDNPLFYDLFNQMNGWHHLPWTTSMQVMHYEHLYYPLLKWLQRNEMGYDQQCIDLDYIPVEIRILLHSLQKFASDKYGMQHLYWDMIMGGDFIPIDWENIYHYNQNQWVAQEEQIVTMLLRSYGFGHFDYTYFEHLSLFYHSPCR